MSPDEFQSKIRLIYDFVMKTMPESNYFVIGCDDLCIEFFDSHQREQFVPYLEVNLDQHLECLAAQKSARNN